MTPFRPSNIGTPKNARVPMFDPLFSLYDATFYEHREHRDGFSYRDYLNQKKNTHTPFGKLFMIEWLLINWGKKCVCFFFVSHLYLMETASLCSPCSFWARHYAIYTREHGDAPPTLFLDGKILLQNFCPTRWFLVAEATDGKDKK